MLALFPPNEDTVAFLRTIKATPADDAPRLIFADYLEEHGHAERAAYIRLQCELANLRRHHKETWEFEREERNLHSRFADSWLDPWRRGVRYEHKRFMRGLVDLTLTAQHFVACAQIEMGLRHFAWVERLTLNDMRGPQAINAIELLTQTADLHSLCLKGRYAFGHVTLGNAFNRLWNSAAMKAIHELDLEAEVVDQESLRGLVQSVQWQNLHTLHLRYVEITEELAELLVNPNRLPTLRTLDLQYCRVPAHLQELLRRRPSLTLEGLPPPRMDDDGF